MCNEILLFGSILLIYGTVLCGYRLFGKGGLYAMTAIITVLANIEVLLLVDAFGMEQTLGNVMFGATYLITDILSENEGARSAKKAVWIGTFTSAVMVLFTRYWLLYTPAGADWARPAIEQIFTTTPRMMLASFVAYAISQRIDVFLYHTLWRFTEQKTGSSEKLLWVRNNIATMLSQLINTVIFTLMAFMGWYDTKTLLSVMVSSYLIFIVTGLLDTPVLYAARYLKRKQKDGIPALKNDI